MKAPRFEVIYDPVNGEGIADGQVLNRAEALAERLKDPEFEGQEVVGCENYLLALRLLIKKKRIDPLAVKFRFKDRVIEIHTDTSNPNLGQFKKYPAGFCDCAMMLFRDLTTRGDDIVYSKANT